MKKHRYISFFILKVTVFSLLLVVCSATGFAQVDKEKLAELKESQEYLSDASLSLQKDEFVEAEADYRKAIALNPVDETGKYNLGTAYYGKSKNAEAMRRFEQAAEVATSKAEKHKAYHNLGNTYMNEKKYTEAVEAYKNALRNNPNDEESRYNLALAKDMLEKNPPQDDGGDDDKKDQDKENQDEKENEKDKEDGDNKEGDEGDEKDEKDQGDEKDKNKEGDDEKDKGKPNEPKEGEGDKPQQQVPGQLSPQQVKSLLEAMNNEEKKVQDKINAQKQKGAKVKSNKDW
tara:strand:- start:94297 stop:95163 length:867 start_codon:yes stop_codon:yes gene_type:complete